MIKNLTPQSLHRAAVALHAHYKQRNENMRLYRKAYFLNESFYFQDAETGQVPPREPDEERLVLPTLQSAVNTMAELLLTKEPVISVLPAEDSPEANDVADHNEKLIQALWYTEDITQRAKESMVYGLNDGWGVLNVVYDDGYDKDAGESPLIVRAPDPINVYPARGSRPGTWSYVIHAWERTVSEVRDEWSGGDLRANPWKSARKALQGLEDTDTVTFLDYWDAEKNAIAIAYDTGKDKRTGEIVFVQDWIKPPTPHKYGMLPWFIYCPSGTPYRDSGEQEGLSFVQGIEPLVRYQSKHVSREATALNRHFDPPLVTKTNDGRAMKPTFTEAGMHLPLEVDEDAYYLQNPGSPPQSHGLLAILQESIDKNTLPGAIYGIAANDGSGLGMSMLRNPTLMKVAFKQAVLERALEALNTCMLRILENLFPEDELFLYGRNQNGQPFAATFSPESIQGYYRNSVKLSASLPTDDAATVNMLATLLQLDVFSKQTVRDAAQNTLHDLVPSSVKDETARVLAEKVLMNPQLVEALALALARENGLPISIGEEAPQPEGVAPPAGDREETFPAQTMASQTPGMPGGNTQPDIMQRLAELQQSSPTLMPGGGGLPPEGV